MIVGALVLLTVELMLALVGIGAPLVAGLVLGHRGKTWWASAIWLGWPVAIVSGCALVGAADVLTLAYVIGAVCVWFVLPIFVLFGRSALEPVLDALRVAAGRRNEWR